MEAVVQVTLLFDGGIRTELDVNGSSTISTVLMHLHSHGNNTLPPLGSLIICRSDEIVGLESKVSDFATDGLLTLNIRSRCTDFASTPAVSDPSSISITAITRRIREIASSDLELVKQCHAIGEQQRRAAAEVMEACSAVPMFERSSSAEMPPSSSNSSEEDEVDEYSLLPTPCGIPSTLPSALLDHLHKKKSISACTL
jgi:hypothetical protein